VQLAALNAMSSFDPLQAKLLYAEALTSNFESVRCPIDLLKIA
jgi:hypothetical protein